MRNRIDILLAAGLMASVIWLHPWPCEGQSRSKLDCQKMVYDFAKAIENYDYRTIIRLRGEPYSKEDEAEAKKQAKNPEFKKLIAPLIEIINLFPAIGEIPDWATEVKAEYEYIKGDDLIEMHGEFVYRENNWVIADLEPRGGEALNEDRKKQMAGELSPAPPEGQTVLDPGWNELIAKLISAIQQKSWDKAKETGVHPGDCGLHPSDPPEKREKVLKLLSQFPSIGPIPAPAKSLRLGLKGTLDGKETEVDIGFQWTENQLKIAFANFR